MIESESEESKGMGDPEEEPAEVKSEKPANMQLKILAMMSKKPLANTKAKPEEPEIP